MPKYNNEPAKIITNVSTINVEEKIPIFVSNQNRLAPQEMITKKFVKNYVKAFVLIDVWIECY